MRTIRVTVPIKGAATITEKLSEAPMQVSPPVAPALSSRQDAVSRTLSTLEASAYAVTHLSAAHEALALIQDARETLTTCSPEQLEAVDKTAVNLLSTLNQHRRALQEEALKPKILTARHRELSQELHDLERKAIAAPHLPCSMAARVFTREVLSTLEKFDDAGLETVEATTRHLLSRFKLHAFHQDTINDVLN